MIYTVYILYSSRFDKIYIGYTSDLISRFHSHNERSRKGWTKKFRPWKVIYVEIFLTKKEAMRREKSLKSGQGRQWIHDKINKELERAGFISA